MHITTILQNKLACIDQYQYGVGCKGVDSVKAQQNEHVAGFVVLRQRI